MPWTGFERESVSQTGEDVTCKKWWQSKTLWVNLIALIASLAQAKWGLVLDPALQGVILTLVNLLLRAFTKAGIDGITGDDCRPGPEDWGPK
jgi:hypothetical protein